MYIFDLRVCNANTLLIGTSGIRAASETLRINLCAATK